MAQFDFKVDRNYVAVPENETVKSAINRIKKAEKEAGEVYYAYVVDEYRVLRGVLPIRSLLATDLAKKVGEVMVRHLNVTTEKMEEEEIFSMFRQSKLMALPLVDDAYRLKGTITINNAFEAIEREKADDMLRTQGADIGAFDKSILVRLRTKMPWLLTTVISGIIMGIIMNLYEPALSRVIALAFFIPLITAMGESVAGQASAIVMEGLILGKIKEKKLGGMFARHVIEGFIMAILIGGGVWAVTVFWLKDALVALVVGITIVAAVLVATINGTLGPLILKRLKIDPAASTNPLVFAVTDIMVLFIYFSLAIFAMKTMGR
jgi:magnesium transporter